MKPMAVGVHRPAGSPHAHCVLVVDDNGDTRDSVVMLLQGQGFQAEGVENGREALRKLRGGYDACLILLDLMMPVMDGWAFRVEQRHDEHLADIPVVLLSATVDPAREARRLGAVVGLQKPLDIMRLVDIVEQYCPRSR
jgi:CheY-like chemotaxis protein